jgi:hypothetical protein
MTRIANPSGGLQPICDDIWGYEKDIRLPGGSKLPSRTTIVRQASGGVIVHSPLAFDDATAKEIESIGEVRALVAPSCIHFLFLKAAMERWPKAQVLAAPGLERKVKGLAFEPLPANGVADALGDDLRVRRIEGVPYITEHVFLHPKTRTLVVTDLVFNVYETRGFTMKLFFWIMGAWAKTAQSRMWRILTKDRPAAARSVSDVLAWDFDRVVVAHGNVVESDANATANEKLRAALWWIMRGARPLLGAGTGTGTVVA